MTIANKKVDFVMPQDLNFASNSEEKRMGPGGQMKFNLKSRSRIDIWLESPEGSQVAQQADPEREAHGVSRRFGSGCAQVTYDSQFHIEVVKQ